jgi:hypothetical protein
MEPICMSAPSHGRRTLSVAALLLALAAIALPAARADSGLGPPFSIGLGAHPRLLPTLHAVAELDPSIRDRQYDYSAKGYFKVGGTTVARLATISGHATATAEHLTLTVGHATRAVVRAAARRHRTDRATLTIVTRLTQTTADPDGERPAVRTLTQDAYLTIPRT